MVTANVSKYINPPFIVDSDTLALWHCNEGTGSVVSDSTGNYDLSINSSWNASKWGNGIFGNSLIASTNSSDAMPVLADYSKWTMEAWVHGGNDLIGQFFINSHLTQGVHSLYLGTVSGPAVSTLVFGAGDSKVFEATQSISSNFQWYHLAICWDSSSFKFFVNGTEITPSTDTGESIKNGKGDGYFGGGRDGGSPGGSNLGVDEIRISKINRYSSDFDLLKRKLPTKKVVPTIYANP